MHLFIIDGIAPFFHDYARHRVNWSKIPFDNLERNGRLDERKVEAVVDAFARFARRAASFGFNAVTLDDLAHLAVHPAYPAALREKLAAYRPLYNRLFRIARANGLRVLLTTDIMFEPRCMRGAFKRVAADIVPFLGRALHEIFETFDAVHGVVFRIGECDGKDVTGDFRSRLAIRNAAGARKLIEGLLPVFESHRRLMVFRTWTVGAYRIGDLIWNPETFDQTFGGIDSEHFVLSMKYGESDFFRFLPLNKLFFRSAHRKLIELQARREYEGFGEYPSFIGWDYEHYARQLAEARNVIGCSVWCQTGGWGVFKRRTFLERSSVWDEINVYTTLHLFRDGGTAQTAIRGFCRDWLHVDRWERLLTLLRLSDEVIKELLYIDAFARQRIYFRRVRVPPLLSVYWDHILVNHSMRRLLRCLVADGHAKIAQGYAALRKITAMQRLAEELGLPAGDLAFQYDTFEILALARRFYFGSCTPDLIKRMRELADRYAARYTTRYAVTIDVSPFGMPGARLRILLSVLTRQRRAYRVIDRIVLVRFLALLAPLLRMRGGSLLPSFAREQAMGIDSILK